MIEQLLENYNRYILNNFAWWNTDCMIHVWIYPKFMLMFGISNPNLIQYSDLLWFKYFLKKLKNLFSKGSEIVITDIKRNNVKMHMGCTYPSCKWILHPV